MHRLIAFALVATFPLAACSADETSSAAAPPAPSVQAPPANANKAPEPAAVPAPAKPAPAEPVRVAQQNAPVVTATPSAYAEGKDYRVLTPAQPTSSPPDKVEVAEVFMYSCPHCFSFEPFVDEWRASAPANVSFVRIPASFNPMARFHTKVFYTIETLELEDKLHQPFFAEFHGNNNRLDNETRLRAFLVEQGVDADEFIKTMNSFAVDTKVRKADTLAKRYQITSVPTVVINGKYVTQASMTRSFDRLRDVMNYLVAKETQGD